MSTQTLLANQLVASTALTANILNLDEGVTNFDGVYATYDGVTAANTSLTLGFENPIRTLVSGANLQTFRARVRKNATAGNTTTVRLEVREAGVLLANSTNFTITSTTGEDITFTWNANLLTSSTGNDVQIAIVQQAGGTGGSPTARRWIEIDTVDWTADIIDPSIFTFNGSGNFTASGNSRDYITTFIGSGSLSLSGNSLTKEINSYSYSGSGSLPVFGDVNEIYRPAAEFFIFGSGSIFLSGNKLESKTDSYSGSGSLSLSQNSLTQKTDFYSYSGSGSLSLSGNALTQKTDFYSYSGSGSLSLSGNRLEFETDSYSGSGSLTLSINSESRLVKTLYLYSGSGNLFSFGEKSESVTYSYTEESILVSEDYGSVIDQVTFFGDYSLVAEGYTSTQDFGSTENSADPITYPYGSIDFSGEAIEKFTSDYPESTQLFEISGAASNEKVTFSPEESTQLFELSGQALESDIDSYVASGSLFSFGEKLEGVTYNYNEQSIGETIDDYGSVVDETTFLEDYGFIFNQYTSTQDLGSTESSVDPIAYPYGSINFTGVAAVEKVTADYPESTQLFKITGAASGEGVIFSSENTQLFVISGEGIEKDGDSYVASGSLFSFGEKVESVTYSYTEQSIGETIEDYGSIVDEDPGFEDYGFIFDQYTSTQDFESINQSIDPIAYPYGSINFTGVAAVEKVTADYPESTQLFEISGASSDIKLTFSSDTTQLFIISGELVEKDIDSYVASGSLFSFGEKSESVTYSYTEESILVSEDYGSVVDEDPGVVDYESIVDQYNSRSDFGLIIGSIDSPLNYPYGSINISGSALDSYSAQTPEDRVLYTFSGDARRYSPVYPRNAIPGDPGSGIGTIRINDDAGLTVTRAVLPYFGRGTILLSDRALESLGISNYNGSGGLSFSGISSTKEINVYQDYVTSGIITISQQTQPITEKHTESYVGIGTIVKFATLSERVVNDYTASGSINLGKIAPTVGTEFTFSSALESFSAQTPEDSVLYTFLGSALEAYSAQTPEDTVLYTFNGSSVENTAKSYSGEGSITFNGNATEKIVVNPPADGNIRFTTYLSDNLYDTCDSTDITCDYENSALVSFIANPPESTQLFNISGSANTSETNDYEYVGVGNLTFSGSLVERVTDSYIGIGTLFTVPSGGEINVNSYTGGGSLFAISGSSESKSSQIPESTILINILGTASTKLEWEYSYSGIGTAYINSSASTSFNSNYLYSGTGGITLSGELVHPDIQFIPAFKSSGLFAVSGISSNSISRIGILSGNRTLFAFSGGFESFSESTYIGFGTIYTQEVSGVAINNPFQIPRTYVVII